MSRYVDRDRAQIFGHLHGASNRFQFHVRWYVGYEDEPGYRLDCSRRRQHVQRSRFKDDLQALRRRATGRSTRKGGAC